MLKRTALQLLPVVIATMANACTPARDSACAAHGRELPPVRVSVKDSYLATHAGVVAACQRIHDAARSMCGTTDSV